VREEKERGKGGRFSLGFRNSDEYLESKLTVDRGMAVAELHDKMSVVGSVTRKKESE
jgi:hypothetical protein